MPCIKKRIGIDLTPLLPGGVNGGVKPLIFQAHRIVREQLSEKAEFVFFTNSGTHQEVRDLARGGDELVCISKTGNVPMPDATLLPIRQTCGEQGDLMLLVDHKVDVLYCPFGAVPLATPGIPTIACIVDLIHIDYPGSLSSVEIAYREEYLRETMRVSESLNCISLHVVSRVLECYPEYSGEVFYTYNAVQDRFSNLPESNREIPCEKYFFFPSNFWPHKNHEVLLIAYQNYRRRVGDEPWHLVLTGSEDERTEEIRRYAEMLNITDTVHFLGFVEESFLRKLWEHCSALVFPSLHEGFGIPLLEAMRFRKPILSSNVCCLPEVGGDACLFFDPRKPLKLADNFLRIHSDASLRRELAEKGEKRLAEFDIERELKKLSYAFLTTEATKAWNRGIYDDGWFSAHCLIGVPAVRGRWKLAFSIAGRDRFTKVSVFVSGNPFGSYDIPNHETVGFEFWVRDIAGNIRLSVADPAQLSKEDERPLGARLLSVILESEDGEVIELYKV